MKRHFTGDEVHELVWENDVDIIEGDDRRWSRSVTTIILIEGKFYRLYWEQGLTENQEDEYEDQDAEEVRLEEKEVVIVEKNWIPV